eukprot:gene14030-19968_t
MEGRHPSTQRASWHGTNRFRLGTNQGRGQGGWLRPWDQTQKRKVLGDISNTLGLPACDKSAAGLVSGLASNLQRSNAPPYISRSGRISTASWKVEASRRIEGVEQAAAPDKKRKAADLPQVQFRDKERALYAAPLAEAADLAAEQKKEKSRRYAQAYRARRRVAEPPAAPEVVVQAAADQANEAAAAPAAEPAATAVVVQKATDKKRKAKENVPPPDHHQGAIIRGLNLRQVLGDLKLPDTNIMPIPERPCAASAKVSANVAYRQRASCARDSTALEDKDPKRLSRSDLEQLEKNRRIHEMDLVGKSRREKQLLEQREEQVQKLETNVETLAVEMVFLEDQLSADLLNMLDDNAANAAYKKDVLASVFFQ